MVELGLEADSQEAEAIVLSCTDMRSVEAIEELEEKLGKPVVTSNQALMFAAGQVLDLQPDEMVKLGKLMHPIEKTTSINL